MFIQLGCCSISALGSSIPWNESRPKPSNKPIRVHDLKYAGVDVASKLLSLRSELADAGSSAIVISMLDEIAWLEAVMYAYWIVETERRGDGSLEECRN
ncbi:hypothetical protein ACE6H2_022219 [Prunus campanulata]